MLCRLSPVVVQVVGVLRSRRLAWDMSCVIHVVICRCAGCTGVTRQLMGNLLCVVQVISICRCAGCYLSVVVQVVRVLRGNERGTCCVLCRLYGCYEAMDGVRVVCCAGCTGVTRLWTGYVLCVVQVVRVLRGYGRGTCCVLCRLYWCYGATDGVRVVCCAGVTGQWTGYVLCVVQVLRMLRLNGRGTCCVLCRLYGCYEAIDGGRVHDALLDLTGGITELIDLKDISSDKLIPIMTACDEMDTIMGGAIFVCNIAFTFFFLFWK